MKELDKSVSQYFVKCKILSFIIFIFPFFPVNLFIIFSTTCQEGNITLHAHLDPANPILTTLCRGGLYPDYVTRLNEAHIQYRSGNQKSDEPEKGFQLSFTATDIDECVELDPCSHECINTQGGYSCRCPEGFFLSADVHNCFGMSTH